MGTVATITATSFPKQSRDLNRKVQVCFHYDTTRLLDAKIIRDDLDPPYLTIFQLDDGRVVMATECQYTLRRQHREGAH